MELKTMLEMELHDRLKELGEMEVTDEKYKTTLDAVAKLTDKLNDINKIEIDKENKIHQEEMNKVFKEREIEIDKKDRWFKNGLNGFSVIAGLLLAVWGTNKSLRFEETGTVTTFAGKNFINGLFPRKK